MDVSQPPEPWQIQVDYQQPALTSIGFDNKFSMLLVQAPEYTTVLDCNTGEVVARNDYATDDDRSMYRLEIRGIGPIAEQKIRLAGVHGGSLAKRTFDGWSVDNLVIDWPCHSLLLNGPNSWVYDLNGELWKFARSTKLTIVRGASRRLASSSHLQPLMAFRSGVEKPRFGAIRLGLAVRRFLRIR